MVPFLNQESFVFLRLRARHTHVIRRQSINFFEEFFFIITPKTRRRVSMIIRDNIYYDRLGKKIINQYDYSQSYNTKNLNNYTYKKRVRPWTTTNL